jgi:hypothetical protein
VLLTNPSLTRLSHLSLRGCRAAGDVIVPAILDSPSMAVIEDVELWNCSLRPDASGRLADLARLPNLTRLSLVDNLLGDAGAAALLEGESLRSRGVRVHLRGNNISDAMKARLREAFGERVTC